MSEAIVNSGKPDVTYRPRQVWIAVVLHLIGCGLGQFYNGKIARALIYNLAHTLAAFIGVLVVYFSENIVGMAISYILVILVWILILADAIYLTRNNDLDYKPSRFNDRWYKYIIAAIALYLISYLYGLCVNPYFYCFHEIGTTGSMANTLLHGDEVVVKYCGYHDIEVGDIIVFKSVLDEPYGYMKRCIAKGGQTVKIKNRKVYVDGEFQPFPKYSLLSRFGKHTEQNLLFEPDPNNMPLDTIPENFIFAMGDNRDISYDSRYFGYVPAESIEGKVLFIWYSSATRDFRNKRITNMPYIHNRIAMDLNETKDYVPFDER